MDLGLILGEGLGADSVEEGISHIEKGKEIMTVTKNADSQLFQPLEIGNGKIKLKHRVILAPLTRNRGVPLSEKSTPEEPNRLWYPGDLAVEYYRQRTTEGGLLISEGVPPSLEVCFNHLA